MRFSEFIATNGRPVVKEAGEYLFRQGDRDQSLYVVKTGLLKAYYLSADGKENIKSFLQPGDNIGSLMACYAEKTCSFNLVCLKRSELTLLNFNDLYDASRTDLEISVAIVDLLLAFAMKKEGREYELLCLSAEDRYMRLLENAPGFLEHVTQNEIARYLGVTPVGLSRIKKRVG